MRGNFLIDWPMTMPLDWPNFFDTKAADARSVCGS